jgi:hypothetical protein
MAVPTELLHLVVAAGVLFRKVNVKPIRRWAAIHIM